jgi:hypothetical protein
MLPDALRDGLRQHLEAVRRVHRADLAAGFGRVVLPDALERKFPQAPTEWRWQFVFPAGRICRDPQFGPPSRYHLHESAIQRAVTNAAGARGPPEASLVPHAATLVRDPPVGGWLRYSYCAGVTRAFGRHDDDDLHARAKSRGPWREESDRSDVTTGHDGCGAAATIAQTPQRLHDQKADPRVTCGRGAGNVVRG